MKLRNLRRESASSPPQETHAFSSPGDARLVEVGPHSAAGSPPAGCSGAERSSTPRTVRASGGRAPLASVPPVRPACPALPCPALPGPAGCPWLNFGPGPLTPEGV
jgi:hypothetical protein